MGFFKNRPRPALIPLLLAAVLLLALIVCAVFLLTDRAASLYADVTERDWFYPELRHLAAAGALDADPKAHFFPTERLTRAAAITMLHRLAGAPASDGALPRDVSPDAPYAAAVAWAAEKGIAAGNGGNFLPEDPLTREQLACFLYRYALFAGLDTGARGALEDYYDLPKVSDYALEPVAWADAYDLFNCRSGGALLSGGTVSRALGAVTLSRFLRFVAGDGGYVPAERTGKGRIWILMYHDVVPDDQPVGPWSVTVSQLRADLEWLTKHGYTFYLPGELAEGTRPARKAVMLTFDDGYLDNYELAFPLLKEYGAKAVISPVVKYVEERKQGFLTWEMCREMADSGLVEIGSHTYAMHDDEENGVGRLPDETPEEYAARALPDLLCSAQCIELAIGQRVYFLAYPFGKTEELASAYAAEHFAMSVVTRYGLADLSEGMYDLPRVYINSGIRAATLGSPRKLLRLYAP